MMIVLRKESFAVTVTAFLKPSKMKNLMVTTDPFISKKSSG